MISETKLGRSIKLRFLVILITLQRDAVLNSDFTLIKPDQNIELNTKLEKHPKISKRNIFYETQKKNNLNKKKSVI